MLQDKSPILKQDTIHFLQSNRNAVLCKQEVDYLLSNSGTHFCIVFFYLSEHNKVLYKETFKKSFLKENLNSFEEEDLYYLYEGIRNQIKQDFDDIFFILHHFLIHINRRPFQNLLIDLLNNPNYKINEIIVTQNLLGKALENNKKLSCFQIKLIKAILSIESTTVNKYVQSLNLSLKISEVNGCKAYFKNWYLQLKNKNIEIFFE